LQIFSKHLAVPFVHLLDGSDPFALAVRVIAGARTLYHAKSLRGQVVWNEMIFLHVCGAVGVVLSEVPATYHSTMIAANAAADPLDAITVIEPPIARSHKIALSDLPESGEGVKRCHQAVLM
jgi:hypothetical protein